MIAHKPGPEGAPTVLLYAHHDVQPENDHADWDSPPFEPTERGDRLYGRGAADDKAGIVAHLGALRVHGDELPVGVTMFVEGEEEIGSPTLLALLEEHQQRLEADVIVIADSGNWDIGVPALTTSLRGLVRVDVEVRTLTHAVHSGMWGGLVPDALITLSRLIASCTTTPGNVAVAGLHSGPAADVEYPEERLRAESGAPPASSGSARAPPSSGSGPSPRSPSPGSTPRRSTAPATRSSRRARAKISHADRPRRHHRERHRPPARATSRSTCRGAPSSRSRSSTPARPPPIDATGPAYDAARAAFTEAWDGTAPVDMGVGGSIPFIAEFLEAFPKASVLVTGVEDPDTRAHGANEGLHLAEFERVVLAEALLLEKLGAR